MSEETAHKIRLALRMVWRWWETYVFLLGFAASMTAFAIVYATALEARNEARRIEAVRMILKTAGEDRDMIKQEITQNRASLRRLERKLQIVEDNQNAP